VEEISRQSSIQAVAQLLLAYFSQIFSEKWDEKEQKDLKILQLVRKVFGKDGAEESILFEEINVI
jgi:hypothetical protein